MAFQSLDTIIDFLHPVNTYVLSDDQGYHDMQIGAHIQVYENNFPDIDNADIVLVGCSENRGGGFDNNDASAADAVRKHFYSLYQWHKDVVIADAGNIKTGATIHDSYAAFKAVVSELMQLGKRVVILGGSHDLSLAQYEVYADAQQMVEAAFVDARIDLSMESPLPAESFLMKLFTGEPNFLKHYNHIGFQSYLVHPRMLETIDKLRFDCFRVGKVKEQMEEMEPVIRNSNLFSFDISAIQHSHAPANRLTPNGFNGEEACTLMQYAGMSTNVNSIGIYGYLPRHDVHELTAKQISHMLWYLMDGIYKGKQEAAFDDRAHFNEYHMAFAEMDTIFLQSKKNGPLVDAVTRRQIHGLQLPGLRNCLQQRNTRKMVTGGRNAVSLPGLFGRALPGRALRCKSSLHCVSLRALRFNPSRNSSFISANIHKICKHTILI